MSRASTNSAVALGGDPEFFVMDSKEKIIPSCGLIGGAKGGGVPIDEVRAPGFTWLEDNVTVELNFPASKSVYEFLKIWSYAVPAIQRSLKAHKLAPAFLPAHEFDMASFTDMRAFVFGCDPDFCAYDPDPEKARKLDVDQVGGTRCASGHIHLAYGNNEEVPHWAVAILLDAFVGLPLVRWEVQGARRSKYGLAGLFRPKPYGIEYRTPSNWWLSKAFVLGEARGDASSPTVALAEGALHRFASAVFSVGQAVTKDPLLVSRLYARLPVHDVQKAINTEDRTHMRELYRQCLHTPEARALGIVPMI